MKRRASTTWWTIAALLAGVACSCGGLIGADFGGWSLGEVDASGPDAPGEVLAGDVGGEVGDDATAGSDTAVGGDGDSQGEDGGCSPDVAGDPHNCGGCGHDCLGGDCAGGICQPVAIATNMVGASGIALDSDNVYWANYWAWTIMAIGKDGGCGDAAVCPRQLAPTPTFPSAVSYPRAVAADGTHVFWANFDSACGAAGVYQVGVDGGILPLGSMACGPYFLFPAAGYLYFSYAGVWRAQVGVADAATIVATPTIPEGGTVPVTTGGVAADGTDLYWTVIDTGRVNKLPLGSTCVEGATCPAIVTGDSPGGAFALTLDADNVYWTNMKEGTVKRVSKAGGPVSTLATGQATAQVIATDGARVYWANFGDSTVRATSASASSPCDGTTCPVLASDQRQVDGLAVDGVAVYWTTQLGPNQGAGTVMKLAK
jgi:sugar lactone lactonase YvrE